MQTRAIHTCDVLIVGGGASGLTASMLLSKSGVTTLLINRHLTTSPLPKAHLLFQKTMELFREVGVEDAVRDLAAPPENWRYVSWFAGFAGSDTDHGRQIARLQCWGGGFRDATWQAASHCAPANLTQSRLEPILKARAEALAPDGVRFNASLISFDQDASGVTAVIEDRMSGEHYRVRARYMLACDGGRTVGPQLGVELEGGPALATNISIHFSADLSRWAKDPEVLIRGIFDPDTGTAVVLVPMGPHDWGPRSTEWVCHFISLAGEHKTYDDAAAIERLRKALGLPNFDPHVHMVNRWQLDAVVASTFRVGRTFIVGDAAHRMPPTGGHGLNTAVQDAYNLSWKLAAVLQGRADEALLDSYEAERRPVAQRVVQSALHNWANQRHLTAAIGFGPQNTADENWSSLRAVWGEGPQSDAVRQRLNEALPKMMTTYNHLNVCFGYTYQAGAIIPDGSPEPEPADPIQTYRPATRPGHSVPHTWLEDLHGRTALGDLVGNGGFVLIAGEDGRDWCAAARSIAKGRGIPLTAFTIGASSGDRLDLRHQWEQLRGISSEGAILVRPDRFIAWRSTGGTSDPKSMLDTVFRTLLGPASSSIKPSRVSSAMAQEAVPVD